MIYGGLLISQVGIGLIFVVWILDPGLAAQLAGFLVGGALVYGGWVVTERGHGRSNRSLH